MADDQSGISRLFLGLSVFKQRLRWCGDRVSRGAGDFDFPQQHRREEALGNGTNRFAVPPVGGSSCRKLVWDTSNLKKVASLSTCLWVRRVSVSRHLRSTRFA